MELYQFLIGFPIENVSTSLHLTDAVALQLWLTLVPQLTGNDKVVPPQSGFSDERQIFFPSRQIFFLAFLDFVDETLFMPNRFLKGFVKKYIDFHKKIAKIEAHKFRPLDKNY